MARIYFAYMFTPIVLKSASKTLGTLVFLGIAFASQMVNAKVVCQTDNDQLQAMPIVKLVFEQEGSEDKEFEVKLADNVTTRAAGFQYVCAETIAAQPILFVFERATVPNFHMRNVVAPIDIAFINNDGETVSLQSMQPYNLGSRNRPVYGPGQPVIAALEVHPGFFKEHDIALSAIVRWSNPASSENSN